MIAFTKYDAVRSEIGEMQRGSEGGRLPFCRRQIMFSQFRLETVKEKEKILLIQ